MQPGPRRTAAKGAVSGRRRAQIARVIVALLDGTIVSGSISFTHVDLWSAGAFSRVSSDVREAGDRKKCWRKLRSVEMMM